MQDVAWQLVRCQQRLLQPAGSGLLCAWQLQLEWCAGSGWHWLLILVGTAPACLSSA